VCCALDKFKSLVRTQEAFKLRQLEGDLPGLPRLCSGSRRCIEGSPFVPLGCRHHLIGQGGLLHLKQSNRLLDHCTLVVQQVHQSQLGWRGQVLPKARNPDPRQSVLGAALDSLPTARVALRAQTPRRVQSYLYSAPAAHLCVQLHARSLWLLEWGTALALHVEPTPTPCAKKQYCALALPQSSVRPKAGRRSTPGYESGPWLRR
jgi:hypothetical protein